MLTPGKTQGSIAKIDEEMDDLSDYDKDEQSMYNDRLADEIDFSGDEDVEEEGGLTIKNAAQYLNYKPPAKKGRGGIQDMYSGTNSVIRMDGALAKGQQLKLEKKRLIEKFRKERKENQNAFSDF